MTAPIKPLAEFRPHTPQKLPDVQATCSCPGSPKKNLGCGEYERCDFATANGKHLLKQAAGNGLGKGPAQFAYRDDRGVPTGKGMRRCLWCFEFMRIFRHPEAPIPECVLLKDRKFLAAELDDDGSQIWVEKTLPKPEDQGPYIRTVQHDLATYQAQEAMAAAKAEGISAGDGN